MNETTVQNSLINKQSQFEASIFKHPFLSLALLCLFCTFLTFGDQSSISTQIILLLIFGGSVASVYAFSKSKLSEITGSFKTAACITIVFLCCGAGYTINNMEQKAIGLFAIGLIVCVLVFIYLCATKKMTTQRLILLLFILAFLLKLAYILYTAWNQRQHDVTGTYGHKSYIYNIFNLPDIDVREADQYYHPPFHHFLASIWYKILVTLGIDVGFAFESIQILTLFYSSCCLILTAKIFKILKLKGAGFIVAFSIIAFHPTFIIFAGDLNNDILSATFFLGAILNTLTWYHKPTVKNILKIALCVGLGMMTKLSVWMVAPAIALVFAVVFFSQLKKWKSYIGQFAAFLGVCAPLALWWPIRNLITYGVPLNYVRMLSEDSAQYVGNHSVLERLFDFNWSQLEWVYTQFGFYEGTYYEYNPTIAIFKTSFFDERINDVLFPALTYIGPILFWSGVVLAIISIVAAVYFFVKKQLQHDIVVKMFLFLLCGTLLTSYYYFCITYPHTCTQNIRYAMPFLVIGAFFAGTIPSIFKKEKVTHKALRISLYSITGVFCAASIATFFIIGCYTIVGLSF